MSSWNYRIIYWDKEEYPYYSLHEVYYDKDGNIISYTLEPIEFVTDEENGSDDLIGSIQMALNDVNKYPVLYQSNLD